MINWKIMETHAENYDGTCRYCGGHCKCQDAIDNRAMVWDIMQEADRKNDVRRLAYYGRRIARTYTYKVVK